LRYAIRNELDANTFNIGIVAAKDLNYLSFQLQSFDHERTW